MTIPRECLADGTRTHYSVGEDTCKDGQDSLVYGLNLPRLEHVTGEEGDNEQHDQDEERP